MDEQAAQSYFPGLSLDLQLLSASGSLSNSIIHVTRMFLPFTKSQVMRIAVPSELHPEFPANAVLKLYDRCWIDDREHHPWSPSREAAARAGWSKKRWLVRRA